MLNDHVCDCVSLQEPQPAAPSAPQFTVSSKDRQEQVESRYTCEAPIHTCYLVSSAFYCKMR